MATRGTDDVFETVKNEYMARIFDEIRAQAQAKAGPEGMRSVDAFRAFEDYFGGLPKRRSSAGKFFQDNIFLIAAAILTITFGAFGLYHPDDQDVGSFLDISKIFAGAVVGGAAGSSAAALAGKRRQ